MLYKQISAEPSPRAAESVARKRNPHRLLRRFIPLLLLLALFAVSFLVMSQGTARGGSPATISTGHRSTRLKRATSATQGTMSISFLTQPTLLTLEDTNTGMFVPGRLHTFAPVPESQSIQTADSGGPCNPSEPLDDPGQPADCTWSYSTTTTNPGGSTTTETFLSCAPASDTTWPTGNEQWPPTLVYECNAYYNGGILYCNIPTGTALNDSNIDIECSTTENGPLQSCTYTYLTIGACSSCDSAVQAPVSPLTGVPAAPVYNGSSPAACPVQTPTCSTPPAPSTSALPASDWLVGSTNGLLITTSADDTYNATPVQLLRSFSFTLALSLLAIPFVLVGFQLMRGVSSSSRADLVEKFSHILLSIGAVIVSFFLIQAFINLENACVQALFASLSTSAAPTIPTFMPSANWGNCTQQFFSTIFNLSVYNSQQAAQSISISTFLQDSNNAIITLGSNLGNYLLTLLSVLLAIQLAVRLALLNAYIIVSPLTIVCGALAGQGGTDITRSWLKGFAALLVVQILQLLVLWGGLWLLPQSLLSGATSTDWVIKLLTDLLPITLLSLTLGIPRLLHVPATTLLASISASIGGAMTGVILIIRGI